MGDLGVNLKSVCERMQQAAQKANRRVDEITLIAVTKYVSLEKAQALLSLGVEDFGENRFPEALKKLEGLPNAKVHFIGHLQTNKVNKVVGAFHCLHSLDRLKLIQAVEEQAQKLQVVQKAFVQVNVSGEETKGGFDPQELDVVFDLLQSCPHIGVEGLMTMAPQTSDVSILRKVFGTLRELATTYEVCGLSMGMSQDFEIAIEEGATHIRVGSLLFE